MMRRLLAIIFLALMAVVLGACAAYQPSRLQMESLPQHYSQFDLKLGWDIRVVDNRTVIEGVAQNVRFAYMYDLEIWVAVLDPAGRVASRSMTFVIPSQLRMDESTEFAVKLPVAVQPGTKLRFTYKYRGDDGGDFGFGGGLQRGTDWIQSFEVVVPAR